MRISYTIAVLVPIITAAMLRGGAPLSADEPSEKNKSAQAEASPISDEARAFLSQPLRQFQSYPFDPKSSLETRIGPAPAVVLETLRNWDGRKDYESYTPTTDEAELLRGYLQALPNRMRKVFTKRLLGFYFVKNFASNGMTNWVVDEKGRVYVWIVLNPSGFATTLSEIVTARDASAFKDSPGVQIDCGDSYRSILYTILHEGTHAYDYIQGITPYVSELFIKFLHGGKGADASWDVWVSHRKPSPEADYPLRDQVKFFGLGGGALLAAKDARRLYGGLRGSPFVSLYGSQTWAEDAADLVTFYHITRVLGQPYRIILPKDGDNEAMTLEPMKSDKVRRRAARLYQKML